MLRIARVLLLLGAVVLVPSALAAQSKPKSSSSLITEEEIERARPNAGTAFDVVHLLRPRWLLGGVADARTAQVHVYIDDQDKGDADVLKSIPADLIYTLKYMSMTEVGARFGPSSGPGIVVTLKH